MNAVYKRILGAGWKAVAGIPYLVKWLGEIDTTIEILPPSRNELASIMSEVLDHCDAIGTARPFCT